MLSNTTNSLINIKKKLFLEFILQLGKSRKRILLSLFSKFTECPAVFRTYTFRIILTQGLNRQIRRMCKAVGNEVKKLKRIRVLNVELGAMKPGEQRIISGEELEELYSTAGQTLIK